MDGVRKVELKQLHWKDSRCGSRPPPELVSPTHLLRSSLVSELDSLERPRLFEELLGHANPMPDIEEWRWGMRHKNTSWWNLHDLLWEPVRAIGSNKRFYSDKLDELMWRRGDSFPFMDAFPDTRATGGNLALDDDGWWRLHEDLGIRNEAALVKHLLNKHEGEMRLVGVDYWVDLSGTGRDSRHIVYHSRLFHPHC